tara:strand:+ start:192 stop:1175 length:984 start_codon:yes stop_codon:yes gene_type:complete
MLKKIYNLKDKNFKSFFEYKKLLLTFFILIILSVNNLDAYAKTYKVGDKIENFFVLNKQFKLSLPKGKWVLAEKSAYNFYISNKVFTLLRIENNNVQEAISITEWKTAGVLESIINTALLEIMFKNKYDGCYDRPEYTILKFYRKGNTHNCFWVGHHDLIKHIYNPDNPELKTANTELKRWLKDNQISIPKVALYSEHSYFSRLKMGKWFYVVYIADPKILNAPDNKFIDENASEYHKYNIDDYPKHKEIMKKWISISAQRHIDFENSIGALKRHRLELNELSTVNNFTNESHSNDIVNQIKKLNDLYKAGILTKDEFEKAKKKLLN